MPNELVQTNAATPQFGTAVDSAVNILQPISQVFNGVAKLYALRLQSKQIQSAERQHGRDLRAQRQLDELRAKTMLRLAQTTAQVELEKARLVGIQAAQVVERDFQVALRRIEGETQVSIREIESRGAVELAAISARLELGLTEIAEVGRRNHALLDLVHRDLRERERTMAMLRNSIQELRNQARRTRGLEAQFYREMQQNTTVLSVQVITSPLPLSAQIIRTFGIVS